MAALQQQPEQFCGGLPLPSEGRGIEGEGSDDSFDLQIFFNRAARLGPLTLTLSPPRGEGNQAGVAEPFHASEFFAATEAVRP